MNHQERLAKLAVDNDRLMAELAAIRVRIDAARVRIDDRLCNDWHDSIRLERRRARHSTILEQLRANRIEALRLLGDWS